MVVPGYEIIQEIGHNDWHALYRGRRISDQQSVLLKILHPYPAGSANAAESEMIEREFDILHGLSIAGVPRVYDLIRDNGKCCLALEDSGGKPLGSLLQSILGARQLNIDSFLKLAIQLAAILAELHPRDIILQNLNPDNILLNPQTDEICIADFSFAARTAGETRTLRLPLRWSLSYISPEQTGRMNRTIDYRTDYYSLGVTFYELLTGQLPFNSNDPLELIHLHIAKTPPSPAETNKAIPQPISDIVMKLLAKTAEQRYQSALGLKRDLETCAREWTAHRRIDPFPLAIHDVTDRFVIPQSLYGREQEMERLLATFDEVCEGTTALMLVSGYSGIGKTSLIQELYKPIARQRGYFISGKFDQVVRGVPFGALIQAFRGLVRQLLTESEERLALWRSRLSEALGANGGVLAEVIPEIELIIGKQPPPLALGPTESLNRFQMVFQNFVAVLARKEHPLVVFLDDLQWADPATLSLLQPLLTSQNIQYLFLIGAYRDNDVDSSHPLIRTLRTIESAEMELRRITLGPLQLPDLTRFTQDTLHGEIEEVAPLARLIWEKTDGNPFFVIQFLETLRREGFLKFNYEEGRWTFRINDIAGASMTDNVIDLMSHKIQRLPDAAQRALTLASCIGNSFDIQTLAIVIEIPPELAAVELKEAIAEGLILPVTTERGMQSNSVQRSYSFLHDRVQQAAYALIPDERKQTVHLKVGRLLLERANAERTDDNLFDVVHHLNLGSGLITDEAERLALAKLNLNAGRRAKSSTAYEAALGYFKAGLTLLGEMHWESEYELVFALHLETAECHNLCGNFDEAETEIEELLQRAGTKLDKARTYNLRIVQHENLSRYAEALAGAREALQLFDVSFPKSVPEQEAALESEVAAIESLLGVRRIDSLIDLPVMTDPEIRMVMNILTTIWSSAYISGEQSLTRLISAMMVRLSLIHGNSEESAYGYATHAITVGPVRKDYAAAYEFGCLALGVNERFNDSRRRAKICQQFHAHANLWRQPLHTCLNYAREACRSGLENGDFNYAIYGALTETWVAIVITQDLAQYVREYTPNLALFKKLKVASVSDGQKVMLNWAQALRGETIAPLSLSDGEFDEAEYVRKYGDNPFYTMFYAAAKLHISYILGEYGKALEAARTAGGIVHHLEGTIWTVTFDFWNGLTLAANYAEAGEEDQKNFLAEMEKARNSFVVLAENCPENYLCQSLLLSAEIERINGRHITAHELYERALCYAVETNMIQYQALANELCARFWLERGQEAVAAAFLSEARACYAKWGAAAKIDEMDRRYASLLGRRVYSDVLAPGFSKGPIGAEPVALDIFSVIKAAQTIAGEIELEKLLSKMMRIAIENAGAERGNLIMERDGRLFVSAEGSLEMSDVKIQDDIALTESGSLPVSIINYVWRTSESVVLAQAGDDDRFGNDPYIIDRRPRSIMCIPVITHGQPVGVLYLENNNASGAFTQDRIQVMQILASQTAISLENARLYNEMKGEATRRRKAEETLRSITQGTAAVTGGDFFASLVRHLADALQVRYAFVTECRERIKKNARTIAFWMGDRLADNVTYEIAETPCLSVLAGETCYYPMGVQKLFPNDKDLVDMRAEGYLGIPLRDRSGAVIGHLAVLDDKPMIETEAEISLLNIFAARAGTELERQRAEEELRMAMEEVEQLKNRLHAENIYLQEEIRREHNFEEIVGNSPALLAVLQKVELVAQTDSTVLILGETGTGKELIARAIHDRSKRRNRPLVKVNCGAISAGLVESELFGHVKGAFTGALDKRTGRFELADGGTLFLDEVGELPQETQVKLLRVLQEGEFEPVGSSKTVKVDVRIIAATNRNLEDEVKAGRFRADLFYRLNVLPLHNPPLRNRKSDIPQLAMLFLSRVSRRFGKHMDGISQETMSMLMNYDWPGNIRELLNLIERGVVLASGPVLSIEHNVLPVSEPVQTKTESPTLVARRLEIQFDSPPQVSIPQTLASQTSLDDLQRQHILNVLSQTNWVIEGESGAAKILNLHPNTLRSRLKKMGIQRPGKSAE